MPEEEKVIKHIQEKVKKVKLVKGQRGGYGWEISAEGSNFDEILTEIYDVDTDLQSKYGKPSEEANVQSK